jgi:hypothetical protein
MKRSVQTALLGGAALVLAGLSPARAGLTDWSVTPFETDIGEAQFTLGGDANGAVFTNDQPGFPGLDTTGATGALRLFPKLERSYDSGLTIGLHASILAARDPLATDRYGGDVFEKSYGTLQTGLGTVELGDVDGAAYRLAISGPKVDEKVSLDDPEITFFRDPVTGRAFDRTFTVATEVGGSLNFAKLSYYTPRLFGVQLAGSFTPSENREVVPFISKGPHVPDRQQNIWELAANYSDYFGPVSLGAYAGVSMGHDAAKTAGHEGLTDWAFGTEADYDVNDDLKLAVGGAYRQSNAYTFGINSVLAHGATRALHLSTTATYQSWIAGGELIDGDADGSLGAATVGVHGYGASVGYVINTNLQLTAGWQQLRYARNIGAFYNGLPVIKMNAEYLHLDFHV